jgi:hypothetical protein
MVKKYKSLADANLKRGELVAMFPYSPDYKEWEKAKREAEALQEIFYAMLKIPYNKQSSNSRERHQVQINMEDKIYNYRKVIDKNKKLFENQRTYPIYIARFERFNEKVPIKVFFPLEEEVFLLKKLTESSKFGVPYIYESISNSCSLNDLIDDFLTHIRRHHGPIPNGSRQVSVRDSYYLFDDGRKERYGYEYWLVGKKDIVTRLNEDKYHKNHIPFLEKVPEIDMSIPKYVPPHFFLE